ncbi:head GIN domain-containing protein [Gaetbulibacter aestuarii]|uniref:Head GIN domain-containing protein n=1 Tax=Gaetbulibacter aestuarii TaxID=1502358 RepID=A0ABW7MX21_9FLAO
MTTLARITITTVLSFLLFSCNFDVHFNSGVKGNGNVTVEDRSVNAPFSSIKAAEGLSVYLTQGNDTKISVEADENLQELILVEVEDDVLKIHTKKNIGRSKAKNVIVHFRDISGISGSSGSSIKSTNTIATKHLDVNGSSGSSIKLDVATEVLDCHSSSGSNVKLAGETDRLIADASSGSQIKAQDLIAQVSNADASSGANISVNTKESLVAKASSGGNVSYYGNPKTIEKNNGVSGSISQR